jgi:hypothetical protein
MAYYLKLVFVSLIVNLLAIAPTTSKSNATVILDIDTNGQLFGAKNVDVEGVLYNVSFVEDSCIAIFDGCNDVSDFDFQSVATASAAAQALLDQVLLDSGLGLFDTNPSLVNGIGSSSSSHLMIPFALPDSRAFFRSAFNSNGTDSIGNGSFHAINNTSNDPSTVWVDFSQASVGEPGAALLLTVGFASLYVRRRRQKKRSALSEI